MKKLKLVLLAHIVSASLLHAQDDTTMITMPDLSEMGLSDLMNMEISIASITKLTPRESPGIVTVITESEIKNSGAVDLQEVLAMVPGFDFGVDVEGVVGIGIRGNWAHEGKVLLLIDGMEMNEELYSTVQMGLHYPVDNIDRIEIIRGPGSAMYGGSAAYAVINIINKSALTLNGASASVWNSMFGDSHASSGAEIFTATKHKTTSFSMSAGKALGVRSNRTYQDVYGSKYDMQKYSGMKNDYASMAIDLNGYRICAMYNKYSINTRDAYDMILSKAYPSEFVSWYGSFEKKYTIEQNLTLTPKISFKRQSPWSYQGESNENEFDPFRIDVTKYIATTQLNYTPKRWLNIVCGAEYFTQKAQYQTAEIFYSTQSKELTQDNYAFYSQLLARTDFINFTAGCRYTQNRLYGSSFVPRVSITKAWDNLHFKALLSSAFRSPSIQNMDLNTNLQAETSTIAEIEAGYCFSESMDIVISGYDMLTKKPIVYYYDEAEDEDEYINGSRSGTRGLEVECRHKTRTLSFAGNYSFYITEAKNVEANYEVPQNHDVVLAFPAHKVSAWASYVLSNKLSIYGSFVFKGPRYGIVTYDKETENTLYKKFRPTYTINIMTNFRNILSQHLTFSAGIKNLFNANDAIIQPYNNLHAPMPGASRQFVVKAAYNIPFKH